MSKLLSNRRPLVMYVTQKGTGNFPLEIWNVPEGQEVLILQEIEDNDEFKEDKLEFSDIFLALHKSESYRSKKEPSRPGFFLATHYDSSSDWDDSSFLWGNEALAHEVLENSGLLGTVMALFDFNLNSDLQSLKGKLGFRTEKFSFGEIHKEFLEYLNMYYPNVFEKTWKLKIIDFRVVGDAEFKKGVSIASRVILDSDKKPFAFVSILPDA